MTDLKDLHIAIIENPEEDTPRLMYADKLEEESGNNRYKMLLAWFIRWQILDDTRGDTHAKIPYNLGWFVDKRHLWSAYRMSGLVYRMAGNSDSAHPRYGCYSWSTHNDRTVTTETNGTVLRYRRGFLDDLRCTGRAFEMCKDTILWRPNLAVGPNPICRWCNGRGLIGFGFGGKKDCACVAPPPYSQMAAPVRSVTLTTFPSDFHLSGKWIKVADQPYYHHSRYPGIRFTILGD